GFRRELEELLGESSLDQNLWAEYTTIRRGPATVKACWALPSRRRRSLRRLSGQPSRDCPLDAGQAHADLLERTDACQDLPRLAEQLSSGGVEGPDILVEGL